MPAPRLRPCAPSTTTVPRVMYSQRVVADALDDRDGARVPHAESLPGGAGAEQLASGCPVEHGVAHQAGIAGVGRRGRDHDPAAAHRLPDVVVRLPLERELDAGDEEGTEALSGGTLEAGSDAAGRRRRPHRVCDRPGETRSDGAIGVRDREPEIDEARLVDRGTTGGVEDRAQPVSLVRHGLPDVARVAVAGTLQERSQVERVGTGVAGASLPQEVDAADRVVERSQTQRGEELTDLLGHEAEVRLDHLGRAAVLRAQLRPLARDADRARVQVARAHHEASLGDQQRGAERDLVRTQQRRHDDVPAGLDARRPPARAPGRAGRSRRAPAGSRQDRAPTARRRA